MEKSFLVADVSRSTSSRPTLLLWTAPPSRLVPSRDRYCQKFDIATAHHLILKLFFDHALAKIRLNVKERLTIVLSQNDFIVTSKSMN